VLEGIGGGRGSARQVQFRKNVAHVAGDGLLADAELTGNEAIGSAGGDEPEHFDFTQLRPPTDLDAAPESSLSSLIRAMSGAAPSC
jgi:hypothetical protein